MQSILLVENIEESTLSLEKLISTSLEVKVIRAFANSEVLSRMNSEAIDLVVVHEQLPEIDGFELSNRLHVLEANQHIPVLILATGKDGSYPEIKALSIGPGEIWSPSTPGSQIVTWLKILLKSAALHVEHIKNFIPNQTETIDSYQKLSEFSSHSSEDENYPSDRSIANIPEFLQALVHEVRNPLTGISTNVQFMQITADEKDHHQAIYRDIMLAVNRLDEFLRDIVEYTHPMNLRLHKMNLNDLLSDLLLDYQYSKPEPKCVNFLQNMVNPLPDVEIDPVRFRRAIKLIIEHCLSEVRENGHIKVGTGINEDGILLSISHDGKPLNARIFQQLVKPIQALKSPVPGLGLAYTKRVLDEHNCAFTAQSNRDGITEFTILIPVHVKSNL